MKKLSFNSHKPIALTSYLLKEVLTTSQHFGEELIEVTSKVELGLVSSSMHQHLCKYSGDEVFLDDAGADVTHPTGCNTASPSVAAVVGSYDQFVSKYASQIWTLGHRVETMTVRTRSTSTNLYNVYLHLCLIDHFSERLSLSCWDRLRHYLTEHAHTSTIRNLQEAIPGWACIS